jgi:osmotically-inducible protein OsmY
MKTDHQLKQDITDELGWDPAVKADAVGVAVKDGVVTLTGHIDTYAEKHAIEKALRRVGGVKAIALELAAGIEQALKRQAEREARRVPIVVDGATVTLRGRVNSWQERNAAAGAAWSAPGVRSVINEVQVGIA